MCLKQHILLHRSDPSVAQLMRGQLMLHPRISRGVLVPHLKRLRLQQALTQADLARAARVSRHTISRGEAGEDIRITSVRKLARALRVEPRELLEA